MSDIIFKIRAKTDTGLLRENNEDNFSICADLSDVEGAWFIPEAKTLSLGELGCVMAVADGMGGMNAGEVASQIAIAAIEDRFSDREHLREIKDSLKEVEKFMVEALVYADKKINERIKEDSSTVGMGTTMVLLWAVEGLAYVCWCGDSRGYIYNRNNDPVLRRFTKDHSYVQQLVDEGKLTEDEAFDHPESNIITRCLGGGVETPIPDFRCHTMQQGDIILLCTDGLCGVCRDPEISDILNMYEGDFPQLTFDLIEMAKRAGGPDNITVALLEIVDIGDTKAVNPFTLTIVPDAEAVDVGTGKKLLGKHPVRNVLVVIAFFAMVAVGWFFLRRSDTPAPKEPAGTKLPDSVVIVMRPVAPIDTLKKNGIDSTGRPNSRVSEAKPDSISVNNLKALPKKTNNKPPFFQKKDTTTKKQ